LHLYPLQIPIFLLKAWSEKVLPELVTFVVHLVPRFG